MNQEPPVNNPPWAKLITSQPDKQNIALYPNRTDEHPFAHEWSIFQHQNGKIYIKNISAPYLRVEETLIQINQEKELLAGDRLCLNKKKKIFDYTFCVVNFQSGLKRDRDEATEPHSLQKLVKIETDLQRELACSICTNFISNCMILTPCLHSFCNFCIFDQLKLSNKCPLCRVEAVSVTKNSMLSSVIQLAKDNFPVLQKPQERKELEGITSGGTIWRNTLGVYIGSIVNTKKEGQGKMIYNDGGIYEGNWKGDRKDGKGVFIFANGDKYDGNWIQGLLNGAGKYIWNNGEEYEGNFQDNCGHGYGVLKHKDGTIYRGDWKKGFREGKGIMTYFDGNKYDGDWMNNCRQGTGKFIWSSGLEYEGDWQDDCRDGYGAMKYQHGEIYKGDWKKDKREGNGVLTFLNGDKYEGKWLYDALQPQVKIEYSNGDKYEGNITVKSLNKQGQGVLTLANGDRYQGNWVRNHLQPQVTIEYANGDIYKGKINVKKFQKHGEGVLTFKNGDVYEGNWMNDKQHGQGKEISRGGQRILKGVWEKGKISGEAIMTDEDVKQYQVEMKKLDAEGEKEVLSEYAEIDDSETQASNHEDHNENS